MVSKIKEKFSNDNFLTEDYYPDVELNSRTWIINSIDGTSHFIKNDDNWGIQLAFYAEGDTKFSVIYLPKKNELYYAAENVGAYLNNNKLIVQSDVSLNQCVVEFGGSIYKAIDDKRVFLDKLMKNGKLEVANILHINSSCISYTNLVSGKTDALIMSSKNKWNIMPGEFLCREAGINVYSLDFDGNNKLFTRNKEIKDLLLDI